MVDNAIPPRLAKRKPFIHEDHESLKEDEKGIPYRRIRSNTVGWLSKSPLINVPQVSPSLSSHPIPSSNPGGDLNLERSNAYFRRLLTLPEKKPSLKQRNKITHVLRKLLFSFSEIYSALKRFNVIGNTDSLVQERMASLLVMAKRQINSLVEVLEMTENGKEDESYKVGSNSETMLKVFRRNIQVFKELLHYMLENLQTFMDKVDVCFIRMLLLLVYGCLSELSNASAALAPSKPKPKVNPAMLARKQLAIPTNLKSHLAGARISVVDPKDQKLYASSQSAITTAKRVCGNVSETLNKYYTQQALASHIGAQELLYKCSQTQEYARKLDLALVLLTKSVFDHKHADQFDKFVIEQEKYKRVFLLDFDGFITTVIRILALFKVLMQDFPELRGLRGDMSTLSRSAKELIALFNPEKTG